MSSDPDPLWEEKFAKRPFVRRVAFWAAIALGIIAVSGVSVSSLISNSQHSVPSASPSAQTKATTVRYGGLSTLSSEMKDCKSRGPQGHNADVVALVAAQDKSCWMNSILIDPTKPFYVLVEYKNDGSTIADNVTMKVESDHIGVNVIDATTFLGNAQIPDGSFVEGDNLMDIGVNIGSYAPGSNGWLIAQVDPSNVIAPICGDSSFHLSLTVHRDLRGVPHPGSLHAELTANMHDDC
jgi:hypothetical protein